MFRSMKFPLGQVVSTPAAIQLLEDNTTSFISFLERHAQGDWGVLCDEDKQANDEALKHGGQILSSYRVPSGAPLWIITEHDRSVTTILTPDDY